MKDSEITTQRSQIERLKIKRWKKESLEIRLETRRLKIFFFLTRGTKDIELDYLENKDLEIERTHSWIIDLEMKDFMGLQIMWLKEINYQKLSLLSYFFIHIFSVHTNTFTSDSLLQSEELYHHCGRGLQTPVPGIKFPGGFKANTFAPLLAY